ncbi:hypothetical protein EOA32_00775 [Mesorhizobium sp. M1A.F.Ca.ET.072.01.1.1]|uniref:hypothetical protein n=1 Tax=Mesorhizobium sp. M1A.F.Ca.ET.072.01.1.1 TaxID=2496753 RepID=UPI000FD21F3E|nr:hypothetical protein [Mesorhizobium sp. M1A.F.Ca.ET.072.01.1.1]RUW55585.1 hypothetical protein EOA32_00775 [Mesorhizobium sp. M1A.F.Ca.ET.072.01.1.1]
MMTDKAKAAAFGVIDKDGNLWPAAAATPEGLIEAVAEVFGLTDPTVIKKAMDNIGARVVPVFIVEV